MACSVAVKEEGPRRAPVVPPAQLAALWAPAGPDLNTRPLWLWPAPHLAVHPPHRGPVGVLSQLPKVPRVPGHTHTSLWPTENFPP